MDQALSRDRMLWIRTVIDKRVNERRLISIQATISLRRLLKVHAICHLDPGDTDVRNFIIEYERI